MLFAFSKFIQIFIWPFTLSFFLSVYFLWLLKKNHQKKYFRIFLIIFTLLYPVSFPIVSGILLNSLESYVETKPVSQYPEAEAIVVLGGTTSQIVLNRFESEENFGSRLLPAARLLKAGKAPFILVSSGSAYRDEHGKVRVEAEDMRAILMDMGVESDKIKMEDLSRNTSENAFYSARVLQQLKIKKILLVTSAFHMRRALTVFEKTGLEIIPVSVDRKGPITNADLSQFIPNVQAGSNFLMVLKEWVGYFWSSFFFNFIHKK